jgi:hypothetical protein
MEEDSNSASVWHLWRLRAIRNLNLLLTVKILISVSACYTAQLRGDVLTIRKSGDKMFLSALKSADTLAHLLSLAF